MNRFRGEIMGRRWGAAILAFLMLGGFVRGEVSWAGIVSAQSLPSLPPSPYPPAIRPYPPPPPMRAPGVSPPAALKTDRPERGVLDPRTGEFYQGTFGGVINPRTGEFLPKVDGGYLDRESGVVIPRTPDGSPP